MKRILVGLMTLTALGLSVTSASAFFWKKNCHGCCETHICCRPYNAFTPICWGNLVCDGCCPSPCATAAGCLPFQFMCHSPLWQTASACSPLFAGGCGDGICHPGFGGGCFPGGIPGAPDAGHSTPAMPQAAPAAPGAQPAPNFTPPPPSPTTTWQYNPYAYGLMRTGYYPGYYPASYNPYYNYAAGYNPYYNYAAAYGYNPYAYGYGYGYGR